MKPVLSTGISKYQHGFFVTRSTFTNLIQFYNHVSSKLDDRQSIDIASFDMSKAFDKLDHFILLRKMREIGFHEGFICIVKKFLIERYQRVSVSGIFSALSKVSSGVPQKTILGPVLFIIYINDVFKLKFNGLCSAYADDLKIASSPGPLMQLDIDLLSTWIILK